MINFEDKHKFGLTVFNPLFSIMWTLSRDFVVSCSVTVCCVLNCSCQIVIVAAVSPSPSQPSPAEPAAESCNIQNTGTHRSHSSPCRYLQPTALPACFPVIPSISAGPCVWSDEATMNGCLCWSCSQYRNYDAYNIYINSVINAQYLEKVPYVVVMPRMEEEVLCRRWTGVFSWFLPLFCFQQIFWRLVLYLLLYGDIFRL